jgi:hypothetical protein
MWKRKFLRLQLEPKSTKNGVLILDSSCMKDAKALFHLLGIRYDVLDSLHYNVTRG